MDTREIDPIIEYKMIQQHEKLDIMDYFRETLEEAAVSILDRPPPPERHTMEQKDIDDSKAYGKTLLEQCGRGYTQTIQERFLEVYKEGWIIKALNYELNKCCDHYLVVPEYSPTEGRLHFHGIVTFKALKDQARLKRKLKIYGWNKFDLEPTTNTPNYMYKMYEINPKTPRNTKIEPLLIKHNLRK